MSRIGRMPIAVPAGVTVDIAENNHVTVKGPKGTLVHFHIGSQITKIRRIKNALREASQ